MSFWDEVKEKAAWAAKEVGEKLEEATEAGKTEYNVLRVRRQVEHLEDEVGELMKKLGRRAFELFEAGSIDDEEAASISAEIQAKYEKKSELEEEIEKLRTEHEEFLKTKEAEEQERQQDKEDGIDGEAIWEDDDRDDGTPPPP
jgi:DNA repair exonuclease SbcCD ATPase subunit